MSAKLKAAPLSDVRDWGCDLRVLTIQWALLCCAGIVFAQTQASSQQPMPSPNENLHYTKGAGVVDVVADCGAVGDGVTDDWGPIQACLDKYPGKLIFFPKMRAVPCVRSTGGGCDGSVDYYVSRTLKLNGNGQALVGSSPSRWVGGNVEIRFSPNIAGPGIWIPAEVSSGYIANLFLNGQHCWSPGDLTTFDQPVSLTGVGRDGVLLTGGEPTVEGVTVDCFGRHGFAVLGDNAEGEKLMGEPDFWSIRNSFAYGNRGYGLYINGGDSNGGESIALKTTGNQLGGIWDHSVLGNTHISPASHMDNRNPILAGRAQAIERVLARNGTCDLTTQAPPAKGLDRADTWITVSGTSGGEGFNGTYRVRAFGNDKHLSYSCSAKDGSASGGEVRTASSQDVYAAYNAAGIKTGAYLGRAGSSVSVWLNPYCESNSNAPDFTPSSIVIGRGCEVNVTGDRTWISWMPGPGWGSTLRSGEGLALDNGSDTMNWLTIRAGRTKEQNKGIRFAGLKDVNWVVGQNGEAYFYIQDSKSSGFNSITLNKGGATEISAPNNSVVRLGRNSTGGVQILGGAHFFRSSSPDEVASIDTSGKATFQEMCLSAKLCWSSGKGAPAAAKCTRDNGGSLYTRTDGGPTTTLYVCDGSTGTWTAK